MQVLALIEQSLLRAGDEIATNGPLTMPDYQAWAERQQGVPYPDEILTIFISWRDALVFAFGPS